MSIFGYGLSWATKCLIFSSNFKLSKYSVKIKKISKIHVWHFLQKCQSMIKNIELFFTVFWFQWYRSHCPASKANSLVAIKKWHSKISFVSSLVLCYEYKKKLFFFWFLWNFFVVEKANYCNVFYLYPKFVPKVLQHTVSWNCSAKRN